MVMDMKTYNHKAVENHWEAIWQQSKLDQVDLDGAKKPFYNLMMFPYPSAEGMHVGNMYAITGSDVYGRFKRMQGYNVFEPIGLDGFGIHSENYALKIGKHPMDQAAISEKNFYKQLHKIGAMFDWSRTLETYDPEYYRWTQWIFVQMFKHGLAYRGSANVNWCPSCKTVLADEQVIDGKCERCGNIVEKRLLSQWFFRITAYADKLLENLPSLDWSENIKTAQKNWIGKKEGITIKYSVEGNPPAGGGKEGEALPAGRQEVGTIECFTTRPDTNFGATFVAIAPEHPFVTSMLSTSAKLLRPGLEKGVRSSEPVELPEEKQAEIAVYVKKYAGRSEAERIAEGREKTGVFTGLYCVNPLTSTKMPLYISDFVVPTVGTGAVVGVPGVDRRDFEFAEKFRLPVIRVIEGNPPAGGGKEEGKMINSGFLNGLGVSEAIEKIMEYLEEKGWGKRTMTYHLRDWIISRQRYWGPPIPMIFCEHCEKEKKGERTEMPGWWTVPEDQLPVVLPRIEDYKPGDDGVSPLAKHKEFYNVSCPHCGKPARRETDVSDTFLDSSWYFFRYPSTDDQTCVWNPDRTRKWLPVTSYSGGAEHAVLHLLYSRFVTMAFHDWDLIDFDEPFTRFFANGLVIKDGAKMSKSKGNIVNPDEYIEIYGADSLRLYLMFMGPWDQGGDFRDASMEGMHRWVGRVWRLGLHVAGSTQSTASAEVRSELQKLIKKVSEDIEKRHYNTAIAAMMEFTNLVSDAWRALGKDELATFLRLLAPFAPHITEELWFRLNSSKAAEVTPSVIARSEATRQSLEIASPRQPAGSRNDKSMLHAALGFQSIHLQPWPRYNPSEITEELVQILIQVNGKLRDKLSVDSKQSKDQSAIETLASGSEKVKKFLGSKKAKNVIFVPGRLINFVV